MNLTKKLFVLWLGIILVLTACDSGGQALNHEQTSAEMLLQDQSMAEQVTRLEITRGKDHENQTLSDSRAILELTELLSRTETLEDSNKYSDGTTPYWITLFKGKEILKSIRFVIPVESEQARLPLIGKLDSLFPAERLDAHEADPSRPEVKIIHDYVQAIDEHRYDDANRYWIEEDRDPNLGQYFKDIDSYKLTTVLDKSDHRGESGQWGIPERRDMDLKSFHELYVFYVEIARKINGQLLPLAVKCIVVKRTPDSPYEIEEMSGGRTYWKDE